MCLSTALRPTITNTLMKGREAAFGSNPAGEVEEQTLFGFPSFTSASSLLSFSSHELSRDVDQDEGGTPRSLSAMVCVCNGGSTHSVVGAGTCLVCRLASKGAPYEDVNQREEGDANSKLLASRESQ